MWLRLLAKLTGGRVVWLRDFDGQCERVIAYKTAFGQMQAKRLGLHECSLMKGGVVLDGGWFVEKWEYEK